MGFKQIAKEILPDHTIVQMKKLFYWKMNRDMLRKREQIQAFAPGRYPKGINLIGDIQAETGLGQSMRLLAQVLEKCEIPFTVKQIDSPGGLKLDDNRWKDKISEELKYSVNLLHINPNIWAQTYNRLSNEILDHRYNIAYWLWELEDFPEEWSDCIKTVDEIWTPSEFVSKSIRSRTDKEVNTIPYAIELETDKLFGREHFGLPADKFLYLVMYDFKSISERKNPQAVIRAYKEAFEKENEETGLVIKINHLKDERELEQLKQEMKGYPNIYYIVDNLSRGEVESLIAAVDVLISLHRSEGFGLPLAEAMYLGTPVIATNWSANTEFMDTASACMVDYQLVQIQKNIGPYAKGNRWAEADVSQASAYMKKLYENEAYREEIKKAGQKQVREVLQVKKTAELIAGKVDSLN